MSDPVQHLADVVNRGFDWVKARAAFRKVSDSKRATEADRKRAMKAALDAAAQLEKSLLKLMQTGAMPVKRKSVPIDWGKVAGVISKGAGALENALNAGSKKPFVEVIDTDGHEMK